MEGLCDVFEPDFVNIVFIPLEYYIITILHFAPCFDFIVNMFSCFSDYPIPCVLTLQHLHMIMNPKLDLKTRSGIFKIVYVFKTLYKL